MENELFRIELNEEGKTSLLRLNRLSLFVLILALLVGGIETVASVYAYFKAAKFSFNSSFRRTYYISLCFLLINFTLQVVQVVLYRRFATTVAACIENLDAAGFNRAFRLLPLQAIFFLVQLVLLGLFMLTRLSFIFQ